MRGVVKGGGVIDEVEKQLCFSDVISVLFEYRWYSVQVGEITSFSNMSLRQE